MSVCITGMHRSGTSMVAKLLHESGVYLGSDIDLMPADAHNADGYGSTSSSYSSTTRS